jgi:hypothetical protein
MIRFRKHIDIWIDISHHPKLIEDIDVYHRLKACARPPNKYKRNIWLETPSVMACLLPWLWLDSFIRGDVG